MTLLAQTYNGAELLKAWTQFTQELSTPGRTTFDLIVDDALSAHTHEEIERAISWIERVFEKHRVTEVICDNVPQKKDNLPGLEGFREFGEPGILISHAKQNQMWVTQLMPCWHWAILFCDVILREDLSDEQKIEAWAMQAKANNAPVTALLKKWLKEGTLVLEEE